MITKTTIKNDANFIIVANYEKAKTAKQLFKDLTARGYTVYMVIDKNFKLDDGFLIDNRHNQAKQILKALTTQQDRDILTQCISTFTIIEHLKNK